MEEHLRGLAVTNTTDVALPSHLFRLWAYYQDIWMECKKSGKGEKWSGELPRNLIVFSLFMFFTTERLPSTRSFAALCVIIENMAKLPPQMSHDPREPHMWPDLYKIDRESATKACRDWLRDVKSSQMSIAVLFRIEYQRLTKWILTRLAKVPTKERPEDLWDLKDRYQAESDHRIYYSTRLQHEEAKKKENLEDKRYEVAIAKYTVELEAYVAQKKRLDKERIQRKRSAQSSDAIPSSSKRQKR